MMHTIELDLIDPPVQDHRVERTPAEIERLALSITAIGLIHSPVVRIAHLPELRAEADEMLAGGAPATVHLVRYECVAGWTRILALRSLGRTSVQCVLESSMDDRLAARVRLAENIDRTDLTPIEEAIQCAAAQAAGLLSVDQTATEMRRSPEWVAQRLNLLAIPDDLQARVHTRELAIGAALALGRCTDAQYRAYLLQHALEGGATVATVRAWVAQWEVQRLSAIDAGEPPPAMPVLNQPPTVTMPCARCHAPHDVGQSCIIRVCQACGREIERELRTR
jgi:ParB family chromosome partitioning protein